MTHAHVTFAEGRWNGRSVREWLDDVVDDVVASFDPVRVIVFGSVARGDERAESDLDLLVVLDHLEPRDRTKMMGGVRRAIRAPIPIDVLVTDLAEYERRKDVVGSPYYWPSREGSVAYERRG